MKIDMSFAEFNQDVIDKMVRSLGIPAYILSGERGRCWQDAYGARAMVRVGMDKASSSDKTVFFDCWVINLGEWKPIADEDVIDVEFRPTTEEPLLLTSDKAKT